MRGALRRWMRSEPFIITVVSLGITLASAGGFWLIAVTYPAVLYVATLAWIVFYGFIAWGSWRIRRKRRAVPPLLNLLDAAPDDANDAAQSRAISALGEIGSSAEAAAPRLRELLKTAQGHRAEILSMALAKISRTGRMAAHRGGDADLL